MKELIQQVREAEFHVTHGCGHAALSRLCVACRREISDVLKDVIEELQKAQPLSFEGRSD